MYSEVVKQDITIEAMRRAKERFPELHSLQYGYGIGYDEAMAVMKEEFIGLMGIIIDTQRHLIKAELVRAMVDTLKEFGCE